ncbi:uncharacterized protein LOC121389645 [Gigantopelta aegis]|uniref:uncharacterized protein LOC121389645 n=1 Tax=Gigantopelta aegis TaxID=1735272 RepID=UPI001B88B5FE|nr:uncharacterized protein LOC121389645 [Gigantopelta aegis]
MVMNSALLKCAILWLSLFVGFRCVLSADVAKIELQFCTFFNNRAPEIQPSLKNCTWFKDNSCCRQEEIAATFGRVKPLRGASETCQRYTNYLMCYICAPNQNIFYFRERLVVCERFCDAWYSACQTAILKGSKIRDLYSDGRGFCVDRLFKVKNNNCFDFNPNLDTSGSAVLLSWLTVSNMLIYLFTTLCFTDLFCISSS